MQISELRKLGFEETEFKTAYKLTIKEGLKLLYWIDGNSFYLQDKKQNRVQVFNDIYALKIRTLENFIKTLKES